MVMKKKREDHDNGRLDVQGINEAEIGSYILSEKEIQLRRIMWDLLHKDYSHDKSKTKKQKKSAGPANTAAKIAGSYLKDDATKHPTAKRSSKINYDALNKIMGEMDDQCNDGSDDPDPASASASASSSAFGDQYYDPNFDYDF